MRLENKIALVTAAASGMGAAGVRTFAREGARVVAVDIDGDALDALVTEVRAGGGEATGVTADLRSDEDSRRIVRDTVDAYGGLDLLWNHVGHWGPGRVEGVDMADYEIAMDLNIRTVLVTTAEAAPIMRARGGGSILFTASIAGIAGSPFSPIYSAAKFGVVGFMQSLSGRYAGDNIRVNAVCPAPVDTPMLKMFTLRPDTQGDREANLARLQGGIPLGRVATAQEVANAALFLLSDEASFITGVPLPVDGGYTAR